MKMPSSPNLVVFVLLVGAAAQAQSSRPVDQITRPRVVGTAETATARTRSQEPSSQRPVPPRPQENPEKSPAANQSPQDEVGLLFARTRNAFRRTGCVRALMKLSV
jgi:hypothetical protein